MMENKHMRKLKRTISGILALTITAGIMPKLPTYALNYSTYVSSDYEVKYTVVNSWNDKQQISVEITNTGVETIEDWSLAYLYSGDIENIWNAKIEKHNNINVIHNAGWNQDIHPGETVSYGFIAVCNDNNIPDKYSVFSEPDLISEDSVSTDFSVINDWETGYTATLTLTNISESVIEDWYVDFDWDMPFDNVWNAQVLSYENNHATLFNSTYNQNIEPGESVTISLQSQYAGNVSTQPGNIVIHEFGANRNNVLDDLMNKRDVSIYTDDLSIAKDGNYLIESSKTSISGTIASSILAESAHYSIIDLWGNVLNEGDFEPVDKWEINDIGFVLGLNNVIVDVNYSDGSTATTSEWFMNYCEDNMVNINVDLNDSDGDGLENYVENIYNTNLDKADTDGDDLTDYQEIMDTGTNPLVVDSNSDGIWDGRDDHDGDGISTLDEYNYGTDPFAIDSDFDHLNDCDELFVYYTNPMEDDTDGDDASDSWELNNNYDPLVYNEKFSSSAVTNGYGVTAEVTVSADGKEIESLTATTVDNSPYINASIPGYMGSAFDFTMDDTFDSAKLKVTFDEVFLDDENLEPTIYYFNEEENAFEEVNTSWDGISNYVTADLEHFSTYILLNKKSFDDFWKTEFKEEEYTVTQKEFVLTIDSSGSMSRNDPDDVRLEVANKFVDKITDTDEIAVLSFDDGTTDISDFTNNKTALKKAINGIGHSGWDTKIGDAVQKSIDKFSAQDGSDRYIILLTDGVSSDKVPNDFATQCKDKNITIITIGLGKSVSSSMLSDIATKTGGKYYSADSAENLPNVFDQVGNSFNNDPNRDSNHDGITDAQTKAMCEGKLRTITGSFIPFYGIDYNDIQSNDDYDKDGIKNGDEITIHKTGSMEFATINSDPTEADKDGDGLDDSEELRKGTSPYRYNISEDDIEHLSSDDYYLSSILSNEYLEAGFGQSVMRVQLFLGNAIYNFKLQKVTTYETELTEILGILNKVFLKHDVNNISLETAKELFDSVRLDIYNKYYLFSDPTTETFKFALDYKRHGDLYNAKVKDIIDRWSMSSDLSETESFLKEFAKVNEEMSYVDYAFCETTSDISSKKIEGIFQKNDRIPIKKLYNSRVAQITKGLDKANAALGYITIGYETLRNSYSDYVALTTLAAMDNQYYRNRLCLDSIINNSDNPEMVAAANNVQMALEDDFGKWYQKAVIIADDIATGASKGYKTYLVLSGGPELWIADLGLVLGDFLWDVSSINKGVINTICCGDTSSSISKDMNNYFSLSTNLYYEVSDKYSFEYLETLAQVRMIAENKYFEAVDDYHYWLKKAYGLEDAYEVCSTNINRIKTIISKYKLYCDKHYDN